MSSQVITNRTQSTVDTTFWRAISLDVGFWTIIGAVTAVAAGPLGAWLALPTSLLLELGLVLCVGGAGLWVLLRSRRPLGAGLVRAFIVVNIASALLCWAAALLGWGSLSPAANWALAIIGDVCLLLMIVQIYALRKGGMASFSRATGVE